MQAVKDFTVEEGEKGHDISQIIQSEDKSQLLLVIGQHVVVCPVWVGSATLANTLGSMIRTQEFLDKSPLENYGNHYYISVCVTTFDIMTFILKLLHRNSRKTP